MPSPFGKSLYHFIFIAAALYNGIFGIWTVFFPLSFFHLFSLDPPRHPAIWQCLGMVVGLYGLGYAYAATRLERAKPWIAIGLAGKILGPLGWIVTVSNGEWPWRTFTLVAFNDLIWWLPFSLFLLEGNRWGERLRSFAPWACAILNAVAAVALLLLLRQGTSAGGDNLQRARYIIEHPLAWRGGWMIWMAAAASLLAFYGWWGARLPKPSVARAAFFIACAGIACDYLAESLYIGWLPYRIDDISRLGDLLTGGAANGLYTLAGVLLTATTPALRGPWLVPLSLMWGAGFGLTASTLFGSITGMVVTTAIVMILFCPLVIVIYFKIR